MEASDFAIAVLETSALPQGVLSDVMRLFQQNYRDANTAYLEKNLGKLRHLALATARDGAVAGFALGESRVIDLPQLPGTNVRLAGLCCVGMDYRRHGLFGSWKLRPWLRTHCHRRIASCLADGRHIPRASGTSSRTRPPCHTRGDSRASGREPCGHCHRGSIRFPRGSTRRPSSSKAAACQSVGRSSRLKRRPTSGKCSSPSIARTAISLASRGSPRRLQDGWSSTERQRSRDNCHIGYQSDTPAFAHAPSCR